MIRILLFGTFIASQSVAVAQEQTEVKDELLLGLITKFVDSTERYDDFRDVQYAVAIRFEFIDRAANSRIVDNEMVTIDLHKPKVNQNYKVLLWREHRQSVLEGRIPTFYFVNNDRFCVIYTGLEDFVSPNKRLISAYRKLASKYVNTGYSRTYFSLGILPWRFMVKDGRIESVEKFIAEPVEK